MGVTEDVRSVIQDLVAPALKSLAIKLDSIESEAKLRDANIVARIENLEREVTAKFTSAEREAKLREESLVARIEGMERAAKARDELTHAKIETLGSKMEAQYNFIIFSLNLDKRVELLERDKHATSV